MDYIAIVAFALLLISCYLPIALSNRASGSFERIAAIFVLGAVYVASVIFGSSYSARNPQAVVPYFIGECVLLSVMLFVSPARGFFFMIVLPIVSQAVFELGWKKASVVVIYLYAVSVAVMGWYHGRAAAIEVSIAYGAGFAFTIAFTIIGVQSTRAREQAERLAADLEAANQQLRARAAETEKLATIQERNRLAREIHDGVGHYLTVIRGASRGARRSGR